MISAIEKHREAQGQLAAIKKSIDATGEEVKKLQDQNNLNLTQMISVVEALTQEMPIVTTTTPASVIPRRRVRPIRKFILNNASIFVLRLFQSGIPKGEIHFSPEMSCLSTSHDFLQKLGEFCHKSQRFFSSTIEMVTIN